MSVNNPPRPAPANSHPGAKVRLSPLTHADYAAWEPLWQGYLEFYHSEVPAATTQTTFQRLTCDTEPMGGFLAWDDAAGRAVGMVHWIDHRSCWTPGNYCYLQDLFVAPAGRSMGTGRALIEAVHGGAQARGCSRVYWLTHETNTDAMILYDKLAERTGFIQYKQPIG